MCASGDTLAVANSLTKNKSLLGSHTKKSSKTLISTPEPDSSRIRTSTSMTTRSGDTSIIKRYISTVQKLLNQIGKKLLIQKKKRTNPTKKRVSPRTTVNPRERILTANQETIPHESMPSSKAQKNPSTWQLRNSLANLIPPCKKQVHFLESPETHHQSQVKFLHHLYPKENNPHLHLDPAPWYPLPQYQKDPPHPQYPQNCLHEASLQEALQQQYLSHKQHPRQVHQYPQYPSWPKSTINSSGCQPNPSRARPTRPLPFGTRLRTTTTLTWPSTQPTVETHY